MSDARAVPIVGFRLGHLYSSVMTLLAGFGLGLSLIVAIGAQNIFVLRQGIRKQHVWMVVVICAVSDAVLIAAGVAGAGAAITSVPWLVTAVRWAGAAFLLGYAVLAARRAWKPAHEGAQLEREPHSEPLEGDAGTEATGASDLAPKSTTTGMRTTALTALALTWLNPHVYLDTVLLVGSVAATHGDERWIFGVGAIIGSLVWFTALGFGARLLSPLLSRPLAWRVLDGVIAVVMLVIAVMLVLGT